MKQKDHFILQNVGGEYLLVPVGQRVVDLNGIITLNPTGHLVWKLLAEHRSMEELVAYRVEHFILTLILNAPELMQRFFWMKSPVGDWLRNDLSY